MNFKKEKIIILSILIILFIPLMSNILLPSKQFSDLENRVLTQKIKWNKKMIKSGILAEKVETYVQDQFPFRKLLINLKSDTEVILGKEENNGVYLGKEGYLFKKPGAYEEEILHKNVEAIIGLSKKLGDKLTIIIAPPSSVVLEEKLPDFVDSKLENEYHEFIMEALKESQVLHILEKLKDHDKESIYFKTDHHWTQYGAYLAYEEFMHSISEKPVDNTSFIVNKTPDFQGTLYSKFRGSIVNGEDFFLFESPSQDVLVEYISENRLENKILFKENLTTRDKYKVYLDGNYPLIKIRNSEGEEKEKILVIKDSYANAMIPYLSESFSEVHYLDLRFNNASVKEYIEKEGFSKVILLYGMDSIGEDRSLKKLNY